MKCSCLFIKRKLLIRKEKGSEFKFMNEKEGVNKLQLLLFCMELPFYAKGIYHKETVMLAKNVEETSIPVRTIINDRIEKLRADMIDPESDYRKLKGLIAFNQRILDTLL